MVGCEIVNTPSLFMTVPDSERFPIIADSARHTPGCGVYPWPGGDG